jgi:mono/diheme cytochrome c family protein
LNSKVIISWLVFSLAALGGTLYAHEDPTAVETFYPEKVNKAKNPLPFNYKTVALGRKIYKDQQCASCHGADGDGKGDAAVVGKFVVMPRKFTNSAVMSNRTDGMLYYAISKGVHGTWMLPREALLSENDRWALVHYIRTFPYPEEKKADGKHEADTKERLKTK